MSFVEDFREMIVEIAPSWLRNDIAGALLRTFGTMIDTMFLRLRTGLKARFPDHAPDDTALGYIGNDRSIERGPTEAAANYKVRLRQAVDSNRNRGGGRTLLAQLAAYFSGTAEPALRLVSNASAWHVYDWVNGRTDKITPAVVNWNWDGDAGHWWWGWVIIDGSDLGWTPWLIGEDGATFDDGHVLGSTATEADVQSIQRIVQKWKPAHVYVARIIVTFESEMFEANTDAEFFGKRRGPWVGPRWQMFTQSKSNPGGDYDDPAARDEDATYWLGGGEEP